MIPDMVSIIMPSWNTEKYIKQSIESVINQSYQNWELLIVDDCSTDQTEQIVKPFLIDKRVKFYRNKKNLGAALTRNVALKKASGEWVAFLDSDDLWHPDKLMHQLQYMKKNDLIFSYHEYEKIDEQGNALGIIVSGPDKVGKKEIYQYDYIGQLTMMYSAAHFGLITIKNIKKNNDYALRLQLYHEDNNAKCYLIRENLAKYRVRQHSISHDKISKKIKSHYDLFHICDGRTKMIALFYTSKNLLYGVIKKLIYERNKV